MRSDEHTQIDDNNHFSNSLFLLDLRSVKRHDASPGRGAAAHRGGGTEIFTSFEKYSASSPPAGACVPVG